MVGEFHGNRLMHLGHALMLLIVVMMLLGVSAAIDIDLFGLVASVMLAIALVPFGIQLIRGSNGESRMTPR